MRRPAYKDRRRIAAARSFACIPPSTRTRAGRRCGLETGGGRAASFVNPATITRRRDGWMTDGRMMRLMKKLNVIGAGRVARTLASLWSGQSTFAIQDVLAASIDSARAAVA